MSVRPPLIVSVVPTENYTLLLVPGAGSILISGTLTSYARKSNAVSHGKRSTAFISIVVAVE